MKRRGLGKGLGMGYKNLAIKDSYVHSLSARGVKTRLNMMGLADIRRLNKENTGKARSEGKLPFLVKEKNKLQPPFPFPVLGDYVPEGYELIETYFVDSSGLGQKGEPALTVNEFMDKIKNGMSYAITDAGQFQVYVGEYKKVGKRKSKGIPRYTNITVGDAFFRGETKGKSLHINIEETPTETLLVGYGWAVYGARDKISGRTTFYEGWDGYSRTTSKQLSQTGIRSADFVVNERREV